ncbi:hypothetical protein [Caproicibacterium sp. XB2]|uniref:hypothetical protein n=1 Tax=Caproicibacterium sp. XB2 TaxID=3388458 RepID=UPI00384BB8A8
MKCCYTSYALVTRWVAPYTGAWIEIDIRMTAEIYTHVAPYTGAWIEMIFKAIINTRETGRSLHGSVD